MSSPPSIPPAAPGEFHPLRLGPLSVWPPIVLAPMAGVTNHAFRSLCREFGAGLYVSEMITARGWLRANAFTRLLAAGHPDERPRSLQLYGSDPVDVEEAARALVAEGVEHIDLNFGCPVPKVTRVGGGSAIPLRPRLMARIVGAAVRGAGIVPVTAKFRLGIDDRLLTYRDAGRVAEAEGAVAVGLHARTAAQLYSGQADWTAIADLKSRVGIPVLGNGDVFECGDALRLMRSTGCDGVIVGRGCLGRPWLFAELAAMFDGKAPPPPPRLGEVVAIMTEHARRLTDLFGERTGILQMRKWATWYLTGFKNSAAARAALSRIDSLVEMQAILARLDPDEAYPTPQPRPRRTADGHPQRVVHLPQGWLDGRDDDTAPVSDEPGEAALSGG